MNAHPDQQQLIKAEASKSRKHLPLRKVFVQASDVLTTVCPCWMASPLSVSQLLDGGKQYFDFVIFDEASQVLPEERSFRQSCGASELSLREIISSCRPLRSLLPVRMMITRQMSKPAAQRVLKASST